MLNFALVGCGRIAGRYGEILSGGGLKAKLAAVADVEADRAESFGQKYKVPHFTHYEDMMKAVGRKIDVICVLTPSGDHARNVMNLSKYGKHLVVEKPMALTLGDADEMIKACDTAGIKLFVVKQNRYNKPVQILRREIEKGSFGKLVLGTVRVRWRRTQEYYDQDKWRGTWAKDGGVFANQASHHIDLLEWMMGDVESVFAKGITALVNIEVEDTGAAVLRFKNGALGIIEASTATRPEDLEGSISILGEKGSVEIGGFAVNRVKTWKFEGLPASEAEKLREDDENPPDVYGFGHRAYLEHVIESINNDKPALVDGLEGRKSLELISAIYESIETGREVFLRFKPNKCRLGHP